MPLINLQQKTPAPMTEIEQQHARLIGVLLSCSKNLQAFQKSKHLSDGEAGAMCAVELLVCLHKLYGGDGKILEEDALDLAHLLGFDVEQVHVATSSGVNH